MDSLENIKHDLTQKIAGCSNFDIYSMSIREETQKEQDVGYRILENQEAMLDGLVKLLTPHCKGSMFDSNGQTQTNIKMSNAYKDTREMLGKRRCG